MKIEQRGDAGVSTVSIDGEPAFTMGRAHSMLALLGNRHNAVPLGAHCGDDYLIRESPGGAVIGRWFVEEYGWKCFWPPGATLPRVERLMRALRERAERAQRRLADLSAEVSADATLPRRELSGEVMICGLNRYGTEMEYAVCSEGDGTYSVGSRAHVAGRTPIGDRYAQAADRAMSAWGQYHRLRRVFCDAALRRFTEDGRKLGVHRLLIGGRAYWFRTFADVTRYEQRVSIESLDDFGLAEISETVVAISPTGDR